MRVAKEPYLERQLDDTKTARNVWIFPLKLLYDDESRNLLPKEMLEEYQEFKERRARKLSDQELQERIRFQKSTPEIRETATKAFIRDPNVAEYAKRRARGVCQLCSNSAPFHDKTGAPYLEVHHVKWLSTGGSDVTDNVVALCPNCHRKMHILNLESDQDALGAKSRNKNT